MLNELAPIKLKFFIRLLSTPSMAVSIPTRAIIPIEIIIQVIKVRVILPLIEVKASFMFCTSVTRRCTKFAKYLVMSFWFYQLGFILDFKILLIMFLKD
jgi:hypothetical protein